MARDTEEVVVFSNKVLNTNGRTQLGGNLPLLHGWYKCYLRIAITVTIGTGTGAITNGELDLIKNVLLKTDKGETLVDLPGRALYNIANFKAATAPRKDAIAAASATYNVTIPIYFVDDRTLNPEDTILATDRYNSMTFEVNIGTVSDLFSSPGTSSIAVAADFEVLRTSDVTPIRPIAYVSYQAETTADPNSQTFIDLEREVNKNIKRLYVHTASSATAGQPFTGTNDDGVIDISSLKDHNRSIIQDRIYDMVQDGNKEEYSLETVVAGMQVFDFVLDGSLNSSLWTGNLSKLQYTWTNDAGVAANDQVSIATEALRKLAA